MWGRRSSIPQAKQKATHDMQAKFREFYTGDSVLVRWPGLVAGRSGPRSLDVVCTERSVRTSRQSRKKGQCG